MSMREYEELCDIADEKAAPVPFHRTVVRVLKAQRSIERGEPVWVLARELGCTCADAAMLREFVRERDRQEETGE